MDSGEDNWCWEQSSIDVDVGAEDVKGLVFVQKGYWINLISTHDVDASLTQADGQLVNLKIKVAYNELKLGIHIIMFNCRNPFL